MIMAKIIPLLLFLNIDSIIRIILNKQIITRLESSGEDERH